MPQNVRLVEFKANSLRWQLLSQFIRGAQDWLLPFRLVNCYSWFEKHLRSEQIQFVYYLTNSFVSCNMPYLYTVLDIEMLVTPGFEEYTINGEFERRHRFYNEIVKKATYVIAANRTGKEQLIKHYCLEEDRILPLPYAAPRFAREGASIKKDTKILTKYNIRSDFVYYPAKIYPHKNHVGVLYGLARLKEKYSIELDAVFSGPDGGNMEHVSSVAKRLGMQNRVHFLGLVPMDDVVQLYKNAKAMSFLSLCGPSNLPSLEALALSCPVINSDVPGAREELEGCAVLVNPFKPDEYADAIMRLLTDECFRNKLIENGIRRIDRWTMSDYVDEIFKCFDLYEQVRRCWP